MTDTPNPYQLHVTEFTGDVWTKPYALLDDPSGSARMAVECGAAHAEIRATIDGHVLYAVMHDATFAQIERIAAYLSGTRAQTPDCYVCEFDANDRKRIAFKHATEDALHILWTLPGYADAADRAMRQSYADREAAYPREFHADGTPK